MVWTIFVYRSQIAIFYVATQLAMEHFPWHSHNSPKDREMKLLRESDMPNPPLLFYKNLPVNFVYLLCKLAKGVVRSHMKVSAATYSGTGCWMARKMGPERAPRVASKPLY